MLVNTYDQNGKKTEQTRLPSEIFEVKMNPDLVHQVVVSQMANRRQVIAHTKGRGEVRGGGKKPWRQKGTGRARAGSIRSPIWKGGGVTFGPTKERNFKKIIPKKMRRKALFMVLSSKAKPTQISSKFGTGKDNLLIVLDKLNLEQPKTKLMAEILNKLPCRNQSGLIALPKVDKNIITAARNLPTFNACQAKDLNVLDLLSFKYLIMPKEAIKVIKETFLNQPDTNTRIKHE